MSHIHMIAPIPKVAELREVVLRPLGKAQAEMGLPLNRPIQSD